MKWLNPNIPAPTTNVRTLHVKYQVLTQLTTVAAISLTAVSQRIMGRCEANMALYFIISVVLTLEKIMGMWSRLKRCTYDRMHALTLWQII